MSYRPERPPAPAATGVRRPFKDLPPTLVQLIESKLGSPIVQAITQPHGFSPGIAARLVCKDGGRAFVKAVAAEPNRAALVYHRREGDVLRALPPTAPAPRLLFQAESLPSEGEWCALVLEDIEGAHPREPWRTDELDRVLGAMELLEELSAPTSRRAGDVLRTHVNGWATASVKVLDPWSRANLARLIELEAEAPRAAMGTTCVHFDLRADNILLTPDRVVVLDWAHVARGASWTDLVCFAPSVAMQGGPEPEALMKRYAPPFGDPDEVTAVLASVAGFFTAQSLAPPPPGLPTLRPFQAAQAEVARAWLARRL